MNTQNKTVELYNRNSDFYWNVEKFVIEQGYKNVCEYCADVFDRLGTVEWCKEQARQDMYREQEINLEDIYENVLLPLNEKYYIWCIPTQGTWSGTRLGGLQDCKHIDMCINYEVQKVTINDKALIINVAHHDGNNQYILYFTEHTEISDISEIPIMDINKQNKYIENYAIDLYDLWYNGNI
nr:MAG TPA: hypothetical protein [Caudoviricetes sp.]